MIISNFLHRLWRWLRARRKKEDHHGFHVHRPQLDTSLANQVMNVRNTEHITDGDLIVNQSPGFVRKAKSANDKIVGVAMNDALAGEGVLVRMTPSGKYLPNPFITTNGNVGDTLRSIASPMRYDFQGDRLVGWQFDPSKRSLNGVPSGKIASPVALKDAIRKHLSDKFPAQEDLIHDMKRNKVVMLEHKEPIITEIKREDVYDPVAEIDSMFKSWKDNDKRRKLR